MPAIPRLVGEAMDAPVEGARALARAGAVLAQLSTLGQRRTRDLQAHDLRERLSSLEPLLAQLATEDVTFAVELPSEAVHACGARADLERCVTGLVTIGRDALPLGGRLSLRLDTAVTSAADGVRRPEALLALAIEGFGTRQPDVPAPMHALAATLGGRVGVERVDELSSRLVLRLARAFLVADAAA